MSATLELYWWQWDTDIVDVSLHHAPRSPYVERFWTPVVGPGCLTTYRRISLMLDAGMGQVADLTTFGQELGLSVGRVLGMFERLARFNVVQWFEMPNDLHIVNVRPSLPALTSAKVGRLPALMQVEHHAVTQQQQLQRRVLSS